MFEITHLESIFLLRRNQEVDLHKQELKTVPDCIFKILQILFLKCFFFRRFFHIFTIANELTGFSISRLADMEDFFKRHGVKSVQIRIYFWSVFSCIWTEYGEIWSLHIQSEYRKIRTRNNSIFGPFWRSEGVHMTLPPHNFSVKLKSGAFYITGQWRQFQNKTKES